MFEWKIFVGQFQIIQLLVKAANKRTQRKQSVMNHANCATYQTIDLMISVHWQIVWYLSLFYVFTWNRWKDLLNHVSFKRYLDNKHYFPMKNHMNSPVSNCFETFFHLQYPAPFQKSALVEKTTNEFSEWRKRYFVKWLPLLVPIKIDPVDVSDWLL